MRRRLLLGLIAASAAVLAVFACGYLIGRWRTRREAVSSAPVVQAVRRIARLATIEMEIADVVRYEEVRTILIFDIPKNATLRLRGKVMGGFDLARGFDVEADADRRLILVRLPAPQVLSVDDRLEWFDEHSGWLNPITPSDRTHWTQWARGALARAAKDAGLLEKSAAHARDLFTDAASAFGWTAEVTVNGARVPPAPREPGAARP
ncbi:MAG TPA: DUF4230 domain-containing protein [Thermoanaerobaculia bacterium]|nr:DUF4230 domain-containing protein [Thermoanaerobaculia bacterium]